MRQLMSAEITEYSVSEVRKHVSVQDAGVVQRQVDTITLHKGYRYFPVKPQTRYPLIKQIRLDMPEAKIVEYQPTV